MKFSRKHIKLAEGTKIKEKIMFKFISKFFAKEPRSYKNWDVVHNHIKTCGVFTASSVHNSFPDHDKIYLWKIIRNLRKSGYIRICGKDEHGISYIWNKTSSNNKFPTPRNKRTRTMYSVLKTMPRVFRFKDFHNRVASRNPNIKNNLMSAFLHNQIENGRITNKGTRKNYLYSVV